jgi:hypothetical protein
MQPKDKTGRADIALIRFGYAEYRMPNIADKVMGGTA